MAEYPTSPSCHAVATRFPSCHDHCVWDKYLRAACPSPTDTATIKHKAVSFLDRFFPAAGKQSPAGSHATPTRAHTHTHHTHPHPRGHCIAERPPDITLFALCPRRTAHARANQAPTPPPTHSHECANQQAAPTHRASTPAPTAEVMAWLSLPRFATRGCNIPLGTRAYSVELGRQSAIIGRRSDLK